MLGGRKSGNCFVLAYDLPEENRLTGLPSDENQENAEASNNPQRHDV